MRLASKLAKMVLNALNADDYINVNINVVRLPKKIMLLCRQIPAPPAAKACLISHTHSMDEGIPSISSGSVGSRFVSQTDLDKAKAVRDEQWKAAYAR